MSETFRENPEARMPVTDGTVERFVSAREHDPGWEDSARAMTWVRGRNAPAILLPFFEQECVRSNTPENPRLLETRRLLHYLDERSYIRGDVPEDAIASLLQTEASRRAVASREGKKGAPSAAEAEAWLADAETYNDQRVTEVGLNRIEIIVNDADQELDRLVATLPKKDPQLDVAKRRLEKLRRARATLLTKYFAAF